MSNNQGPSAKPDFGIKPDLSDFAPAPAAKKPMLDERARADLRRASDEQGFTNREPQPEPLRLRRAKSAPTVSFTVRLTVEDFNEVVAAALDSKMGRADFIVAAARLWQQQKKTR